MSKNNTVSYNKMSKSEKRKLASQKRTTWADDYGINPVTRVVPSGKTYNRKKSKSQDFDDED